MWAGPLYPSDIGDASLRLGLAFLVTGVIGNNRHRSDKPAGFRTHVLVGIASCLMMLVSIHMAEAFKGHSGWQPDPGRIAAQVVTGIGFLGAGTILHQGATVRGLTTAATLWASACLGLSAGAGMYGLTIICFLVMLLSITVFDRIQTKVVSRRLFRVVKLTCQAPESGKFDEEIIPQIEGVASRYGKAMRNLTLKTNKGEKHRIVIQFNAEFFNNLAMLTAVDAMQKLPFVESVSIEV